MGKLLSKVITSHRLESRTNEANIHKHNPQIGKNIPEDEQAPYGQGLSLFCYY
jgi:hypothetical protein